jgi:hypothetical protein
MFLSPKQPIVRFSHNPSCGGIRSATESRTLRFLGGVVAQIVRACRCDNLFAHGRGVSIDQPRLCCARRSLAGILRMPSATHTGQQWPTGFPPFFEVDCVSSRRRHTACACYVGRREAKRDAALLCCAICAA